MRYSASFIGVILVCFVIIEKANASCPTSADWRTFTAGGNDIRCYYLSGTTKFTWEKMKSMCTNKGGTPLNINSKAVADFLKGIKETGSFKLENYWVGITRIPSTTNWQNHLGSQITFLKWKDTPSDESKKCAYADRGNGDEWLETDCTDEFAAVCEKAGGGTVAAPAIVCGANWTGPHSGFKYRYHPEHKKFHNAKTVCSNEGGSLASIHSQTEWTLVQGLICDAADQVWIGLKVETKLKKSSAKWIDGSTLCFEPSSFIVDTNKNDLAVRMQKSGSWNWNDIETSKSYAFLCKREMNLALNKVTVQRDIGSGGVASRAVDGNRNSVYRGQNSCTHTGSGDDGNNWWAVDLGAKYNIERVVLYNRADCCSSRLANFDIVVLETMPMPSRNLSYTSAQVCAHQDETVAPGGNVTLQCLSNGRFLAVAQPRNVFLTLCEVEVFEKVNFSTGFTCPEPLTSTALPETTTPLPETSSISSTTKATTTTTSTTKTTTTTKAATTTSSTTKAATIESTTLAVPKATQPSTTTITPQVKTTTTTATIATTVPVTTTTPPVLKRSPKNYILRKGLHVGYTRSPSPCITGEWAYSNQTGNCYMFYEGAVTQVEAVEACEEINAELLSIQNQDEQHFVDKILKFDYNDHWTLGRKNESGEFFYGNDEITYNNWLDDRLLTPTKDGDDVCLALVKNVFTKHFFLMNWKWDTKHCNAKKSFVCQTIAKRCPALPTAPFVAALPPKPFIELTINYKCLPGHVLPNYTLRYSEWKARKPSGIIVTKEDIELWLASRPNITTMPSMTYDCFFPGKWSAGSLAPCEPKTCPYPTDVKYAERNSSDHIFPAWIEYKCEHGYHFRQDNSSTRVAWCSPDAEWIDVPTDCDPVECEPFPRVGNATVDSSKNRYREAVVWTCLPGHMYPDRSVRQWVGCRENYVNWQIGRWNVSKLDDCGKLVCRDPPIPGNTTRSSNATAYKSIITYTCIGDEFEFPSGDDAVQAECGDEAMWKPPVAHCRKKPPKLKMKGKKYEPPAKESAEAKTVGTLAIIIMIVLLVLTVLIDLGTCYQGLRFLRYNVTSFNRYYGLE